MKKVVSALLSGAILAGAWLLGILTLPSMTASAGSPYKYEGDYMYEPTQNGSVIIEYVGSGRDVVIPSTLGGKPVTKIEVSAFEACGGLTSVEIPDSVKTVGNCAFARCPELTEVKFPDSMEAIGGDSLFVHCTKLTSVKLPNGITEIEGSMFYNCTSLTDIELPDSVKTIGRHAFYGTGFTGFVLPDTVTALGSGVFSGCANLTNLTVDGKNPTYYASGNCILEKGTGRLVQGCAVGVIPNGATEIGTGAFAGFTGLTGIQIPNSVKTIGESAFDGSGLARIEIPGSVETLGERAFANCPDLTHLTVASGNPTYYASGNCILEKGTDVLIAGCRGSVIPQGVKAIGRVAFSFCAGLTEIEIPNSVETIGSSAFEHCEDLTSVTLPDSVTEIGPLAFFYCTALTDVEIPDSMESIRYGAFAFCKALTSIVIPDSVETMGEIVFYECTSLTDVYCEASEQPEGWDDYWLDGCNATVHWGNSPALSMGDLGGNGTIDATDYLLLKRFCLGSFSLTDAQKAVADVNRDGQINALDYMLVKRHVLGTFKIG